MHSGAAADAARSVILPDPPRSGCAGGRVAELSAALGAHRVYGCVDSAAALRMFMEHHVVAVWDFMSLLKSLQRDLTTVNVPWTPPADPEAARLVNEIVLGEESDEVAPGVVRSHFEWYLEGMDEAGASTAGIRTVLSAIRGGADPLDAIARAPLPAEAKAFASGTMRALGEPVHVRAAVFFHGREAVIPSMFIGLVERLAGTGVRCGTFVQYLHRHIVVDSGEHGPRAETLLARLTGGDPARRADAERAAVAALEARVRLWDAIADAVAAGR